MPAHNTVRYGNRKLILLAGASGSGKSTLARKLRNNSAGIRGMENLLPQGQHSQVIKPRDLVLFYDGSMQPDRNAIHVLHIAINNIAGKKKLIEHFIDQTKPEELIIVTLVPDRLTLARMYFKRMVDSCGKRPGNIPRSMCIAIKLFDIPKMVRIFRYLFTNILHSMHTRWDSYAETLCDRYAGMLPARTIHLKPIYNRGGGGYIVDQPGNERESG